MIRIRFFVVIIIACTCFIAGCCKDEPKPSREDNNIINEKKTSSIESNTNTYQFPSLYDKYKISNLVDSNNLITEEYSIDELTNYFGINQYSSNGYYTYINDYLSIDEVNKNFLIQCTRYNNSYYTVYKVKEGGLYFVLWAVDSKNNYIAGTADYIFKINNITDFKSLEIGESTYSDLVDIDPSAELDIYTSLDLYSVSLLNNGEILVVYYSDKRTNEDGKLVKELTGDDLIIKSMETSGSIKSLLLTQILDIDLDLK